MKPWKAAWMVLCSCAFSPFCFALDPQNPESYCERFLTQQEITTCQKKIKNLDLDWYAAAVCNQLESDRQFEKCLQKISGRPFSPQILQPCETALLDDAAREKCLFSGRAPSSTGKASERYIYQKLKGRSVHEK